MAQNNKEKNGQEITPEQMKKKMESAGEDIEFLVDVLDGNHFYDPATQSETTEEKPKTPEKPKEEEKPIEVIPIKKDEPPPMYKEPTTEQQKDDLESMLEVWEKFELKYDKR